MAEKAHFAFLCNSAVMGTQKCLQCLYAKRVTVPDIGQKRSQSKELHRFHMVTIFSMFQQVTLYCH